MRLAPPILHPDPAADAGQWRLAVWLGLRFGLSTRHKGFLTLVSMLSLIGMVLGVASLIVVLSVMNGLQHSLQARLLVLVPQLRVLPAQGLLADPDALAQRIAGVLPDAVVSPYLETTVLLSSGQAMHAARLLGVVPAREPGLQRLLPDSSALLQPGNFNVILGQALARQLGVRRGDTVSLLLPQMTVTPAGVFPRTRLLTVAGLLATGSQVDAEYALLHLQDARRLHKSGSAVDGLRLHYGVTDAVAADRLRTLLGEADFRMDGWRSIQGPLFDAVQMEKRMIAVLLFVVIVVAAFNIVAVLGITVAQKRPAIAILRTLGASGASIRLLFLVQGMVLGLAGVALGSVLGLLLATHLNALVHGVESALGLYLFDPALFAAVDLPVRLQAADFGWIIGGALCLSFLSCLVPAWQASRQDPADSLRAL